MATVTAVQIVNAVRKALSQVESVTEVAEKAGIHRISLYQFKAGSRGFPLPTLVKLADALGLEITVQPKKRR
jgi:DNA-binding phage protein